MAFDNFLTFNPFCLLCYSNRAKMKNSNATMQSDAVTSPKVKMGYGMSSVKRLSTGTRKKKREAANPHAFADEQYGENENQSDSNLNDDQSMEEPNTDSTSDQARNDIVIYEVLA